MDLFEIPIRKFVVSLSFFRVLVVDFKIPLSVFQKTVDAKEFVSSWADGRCSLHASPLVEYKSVFVDKDFGMVKCLAVECHGHN